MRRVFARLQRLLAAELATRNIELISSVAPETLEVTADTELLDQALINLMRNAMEALRDEPAGRIALSAHQEPGGHVVVRWPTMVRAFHPNSAKRCSCPSSPPSGRAAASASLWCGRSPPCMARP